MSFEKFISLTYRKKNICKKRSEATIINFIFCIGLFFLFISPNTGYSQVPPMPAAIGGTVTVDGVALTQDQAAVDNYTFRVTKLDGSAFNPPAESSGLNPADWYRINIPIFNATTQPGGANPGDTAVIKVYKGGTELVVNTPANGRLTVGDDGSTTQINLDVSTEVAPAPAKIDSIPTMTQWGLIIMSVLFVLSALYMRRRGQI